MTPIKKQPSFLKEWGHVIHSSYHNLSHWSNFNPDKQQPVLAGPSIVLEFHAMFIYAAARFAFVSLISIFLGDAREDIFACCSKIIPLTRKRKAKGSSSHMLSWEPHLQSFNQIPSSWPSSSWPICIPEHPGMGPSVHSRISAPGR